MTRRVAHPKSHRRRRLWFGLSTGLVGLLLVIYLSLNVIVAFATQKGLDRLKSASASFHSVRVTILQPGYDIYGLKVTQMPAEEQREPLLYADRIEMRWSWRELLRGHLVRRVKIWSARVMVPMRPGENGKPAQPPLEIARTLESVPSAGLERLSVVHSQIILVDLHHEGERLWLHDLDATVENVASRKSLMRGLPVLVTARGKLQKTGSLAAFVTLDPFDKGLTFAGSAEVRHMALSDLRQFTNIAGLTLPAGQIDVFASFTCKRGVLTGGIKPILQNVEVQPADDSLGNKLKALLADAAVNILSDRVPGRNAVAAIIPIHGDLKNLQAQLVPAVLAVLRNAFVEGLSASLSNVPPPVEDRNILRQAVDALRKKSDQPVVTEPTDK